MMLQCEPPSLSTSSRDLGYGGTMSLSIAHCRCIGEALGCSSDGFSAEIIAGDASPRRYYRIQLLAENETKVTVIFVTSPPSENNREFLSVQHLLSAQGVRVPGVIASDVEAGWFLLEDFGDALLSASLSAETVQQWYERAFVVLRQMQCPENTDAWSTLPRYDRERLQAELDVFPHWFIQNFLDLPPRAMSDSGFDALCDFLNDSALAQPQTLVHRDFHSRNLMCLLDGSLGVIDFQDAVVGPVMYDPVSLLKDCYIEWPRSRQLEWLSQFIEGAIDSDIRKQTSTADWVRWFDLMGLQRHLKVLGVFSRLSLRDGKHDYLHDIPRVMRYVREALTEYATLSDIAHFTEWWVGVVEPATKDWSELLARRGISS